MTSFYRIESAKDLPEAVKFASGEGAGSKFRWYVARMAKAYGKSDLIPKDWDVDTSSAVFRVRSEEELQQNSKVDQAVDALVDTAGKVVDGEVDAEQAAAEADSIMASAARAGIGDEVTQAWRDGLDVLVADGSLTEEQRTALVAGVADKVIKRVRTLAGVKRYKAPIGTPIIAHPKTGKLVADVTRIPKGDIREKTKTVRTPIEDIVEGDELHYRGGADDSRAVVKIAPHKSGGFTLNVIDSEGRETTHTIPKGAELRKIFGANETPAHTKRGTSADRLKRDIEGIKVEKQRAKAEGIDPKNERTYNQDSLIDMDLAKTGTPSMDAHLPAKEQAKVTRALNESPSPKGTNLDDKTPVKRGEGAYGVKFRDAYGKDAEGVYWADGPKPNTAWITSKNEATGKNQFKLVREDAGRIYEDNSFIPGKDDLGRWIDPSGGPKLGKNPSRAGLNRFAPNNESTDDDAMSLLPEKKGRGSAEWNDAISKAINEGGFSFRDTPGDGPKDGYMVSVNREAERPLPLDSVSPQVVSDYIDEFGEILDGNPDKYIGGWVHKGKLYLDISTHVKDRDEAEQFARDHNQLAIWDNANKIEIKINDVKPPRDLPEPKTSDEYISQVLDNDLTGFSDEKINQLANGDRGLPIDFHDRYGALDAANRAVHAEQARREGASGAEQGRDQVLSEAKRKREALVKRRDSALRGRAQMEKAKADAARTTPKSPSSDPVDAAADAEKALDEGQYERAATLGEEAAHAAMDEAETASPDRRKTLADAAELAAEVAREAHKAAPNADTKRTSEYATLYSKEAGKRATTLRDDEIDVPGGLRDSDGDPVDVGSEGYRLGQGYQKWRVSKVNDDGTVDLEPMGAGKRTRIGVDPARLKKHDASTPANRATAVTPASTTSDGRTYTVGRGGKKWRIASTNEDGTVNLVGESGEGRQRWSVRRSKLQEVKTTTPKGAATDGTLGTDALGSPVTREGTYRLGRGSQVWKVDKVNDDGTLDLAPVNGGERKRLAVDPARLKSTDAPKPKRGRPRKDDISTIRERLDAAKSRAKTRKTETVTRRDEINATVERMLETGTSDGVVEVPRPKA